MNDWFDAVKNAAENVCKDTDTLVMCLHAMAAHPNLTPENTILLQMQNPDATEVGGYRAWTEQYNRKINPDAKPLVLLRPTIIQKTDIRFPTDEDGGEVIDKAQEFACEGIGFTAVNLYDISQTKAEDDSKDVIKDYPLTADEIIAAFRALTDCEVLPAEVGDKPVCYDYEENSLKVGTDNKPLIAAVLVKALAKSEAEKVLPDIDKLYIGLVSEAAAEVVLTINELQHTTDILLFNAWRGDDGKSAEMYLEMLGQIYWTARRVMFRLRTAVGKPISLDFGETCLVNELLVDTDYAGCIKRIETLMQHTGIPVLIEQARSLKEKLKLMNREKLDILYADRCNHRVWTQPVYRI